MLSQKCYECALKHCATALSYAKEILGGHAEGNPLDHRIDLLGELCNLEHHLELLDQGLLHETQAFRRTMQAHGMVVREADLQRLRDFYTAIEKASESPEQTPVEAPRMHVRSREAYKVVIDSPHNPERFQACYEGLRRHVLNTLEIVAINPTIDVSADVQVFRGGILDFAKSIDDECFVYMTENDFIINRCDLNLLPPIYLQEKAKNSGKYKDIRQYPYEWDCGAPHVLDRERLIETYDGDVLNDYHIKGNETPAYCANRYVVRVQERLCCGTLHQAESGYIYATALDDAGFHALMEWMDKRGR